jgi:NADH-quinone oxidoreductase subunit L
MVTIDDEETSHDHHHGLGSRTKASRDTLGGWLPLVLLAIPSVAIGYIAIGPMVLVTTSKVLSLLIIMPTRSWSILAEHFHGAAAMGVHSLTTLAIYSGFSWCCRLPGSST